MGEFDNFKKTIENEREKAKQDALREAYVYQRAAYVYQKEKEILNSRLGIFFSELHSELVQAQVPMHKIEIKDGGTYVDKLVKKKTWFSNEVYEQVYLPPKVVFSQNGWDIFYQKEIRAIRDERGQCKQEVFISETGELGLIRTDKVFCKTGKNGQMITLPPPPNYEIINLTAFTHNANEVFQFLEEKSGSHNLSTVDDRFENILGFLRPKIESYLFKD